MRTIPDIGFPGREYQGYAIAIEPFAACVDEFKPLHVAQWDEIEEQRPAFRPDYQRFMDSEAIGQFFQITARQDGELVGGVGFFVTPSIWTQLWIAEETALYLKPEHRKGLLASTLCQYAEQVCRALGVSEIVATVKSYAKTGVILRRQKFRQTDSVWIKNLEVENVQ